MRASEEGEEIASVKSGKPETNKQWRGQCVCQRV